MSAPHIPKPTNPHYELPCEMCNAEDARHQVTVIVRLIKVDIESMYMMDLGSNCYAKWILEQMPRSATRFQA